MPKLTIRAIRYRHTERTSLIVEDIILTRMTTFIKTKFKISDDQTNVEKYRIAANNTEYHYYYY